MKTILENRNDDIEGILRDLKTQLLTYCPDKKKTVSAAVLAVEEILLLCRDDGGEFKASVAVIKDIKRLAVCIKVPDRELSEEELFGMSPRILERIQKHSALTVRCVREKGGSLVELTVQNYKPFRDNVAYAMRYVGKNRGILLKGEVTQVIGMIATLCIPALTASLIVGYTDNDMVQIAITALSIFLASLIKSIMGNTANISYNRVFYRIRTSLETDLAASILTVREECFEENGTGPFISRVAADVMNISTGLNTMFDMATETVYYSGILIATLILDRCVFLCEIATLVILYLIERVRGINFDVDSRLVNESEEKRAGLIVDIINGENDIKLLSGENFFREKMKRYAEEAGNRNERKITRSRRTMIAGESVTALCYMVIMLILGYLLTTGRNSLAVTLVLFNYFTNISTPFILLIQRFVEFIRTFNLSCERVRNLQEGSEFPKESFGTRHLDSVRGEIEIKEAVFAYNHNNIFEPDTYVIKGLSLIIRPGETVALVGKSGSGKTTLLRLISGQRSCSSGNVLIDGVNIEELDKSSLRNNMMVVSQSPYFFNASIRENLMIAKPDATTEELRKVCELACIRDEIESMQNGYETAVGEMGVRLSGGQKQRLAIARGLLRGARIILFDEATSAIDNITQARIKETIDRLSGDHTVVIIAHRLSTIVGADRIVLIEDGMIAAQGTHRELMESCEKYRQLYSAED